MEHPACKCLLPNMRVEEGSRYSEEMWHARKMLQPCALIGYITLFPDTVSISIDRNLRFRLVGIES